MIALPKSVTRTPTKLRAALVLTETESWFAGGYVCGFWFAGGYVCGRGCRFDVGCDGFGGWVI